MRVMTHVVAASTAVCVVLSACGPSPRERQFAADDGWTARMSLERDAVVVESPYDEVESRWWADAIDAEFARLATLFEVPHRGRARVRLVPIPMEGADDAELVLDLVRARNAERDTAHADASFVVYVPDGGAPGLEAVLSRTDVVRHELAHGFVARVFGESAPRWLHEGVAASMEQLLVDGRQLVLDALPPDAIFALRGAPTDGLADLLAWGPASESDVRDPGHTARRYRLALAFVWRGLLAGDGAFRARLEGLAHRPHDELLAREADLLSWIGTLEPAHAVLAALRSDEVAVRLQALERLCDWTTDPTRAGTRTREIVELAAVSLDDPRTFGAASRFLLFVRPSPAQDDVLLRRLLASPDAGQALLGLALLARLDGEPDLEVVHRLWNGLDVGRRSECMGVASIFDLQVVPERRGP